MTRLRLLISLTLAFTLFVTTAVFAQQPPNPPPQPPRPLRPLRPLRAGDGRVELTEPFARTVKVGANSALLVVNTRGEILVSAGGAGQIEISAIKRGRGSNDDEAKRRLAQTQIQVYANGNRVEVRNESENGGAADFTITVPSDCAVDLRAVSGDMKVVNVKGELRTQAVSGNVILEGTSRVALVKTVSGDVQITNGGGSAGLSIATVSGDVVANGLSARGLELNSVSGDFRLGGWTGDRLDAHLLSGDFELNGSLIKGGRYDVETHSGDVRLVLGAQPGFEVDATTFSGTIGITFNMKTEDFRGPVTTGRGRGPRSVRGTYGDASASVRVQTFSGNIVITPK